MKEQKIPGGYYLKARKTQESWIAHAPPHVREIWDWLLHHANYADKRLDSGLLIKRGQCLCSYDTIRDGLHWMVGWRKERYSKWDCEKAMKALTKATMIATTKTTRGMIVTIQNYDYYQNPENYESHNESHRKATRKPQSTDTIEEEREESIRKKEKEHIPVASLPEAPVVARSPSLDSLMERYTEVQRKTIDEYWTGQRRLRRTGKIAHNVIVKWMDKWSEYDAEVVVEGMSIHMNRAQGKEEPYTHGIIRRVHKTGVDNSNNGTNAERQSKIERAKSVLKYDGEEDCKVFCEKIGINFEEVRRCVEQNSIH